MSRPCGSQRRRGGRAERGLTLLELLLAVAITAMIGMAMSTAMTATARGMVSAGDARSALQRAHVAYTRLRAYTSAARALLQCDPSRGFALWLDDSNPGGRVNLSELRCFWYDSAAGTITTERLNLPESWSDDIRERYDRALDPSADFLAALAAERAAGYTVQEPMVDGLAGWMLEYDGPDPQVDDRFRLTLRVLTTDNTDGPVLMTFGLINHTVPR